MSYVTASYRPAKDGSMDIPLDEDGQPFEWGMVYSQRTRIVWFQDVQQAVAALAGDPGYLDLPPTDQMVSRILVAVRAQVALQARINLHSQITGNWALCTGTERKILNGSRHTQPIGWSFELLGMNHWSAPGTPLVVVSTGYYDAQPEEVPVGEPGALIWLCPETDEDLLDSFDDAGLVHIFHRAEE